jgi:hypothetical protein
VDPRAGVDDLEKRKFSTLSGFELRPLGHPAHNQSLYRLPYPGSPVEDVDMKIFIACPFVSWSGRRDSVDVLSVL